MIVTLLPIAAIILFILSLRGLSSAATSKRGNSYGMVGMAISMAIPLISATYELFFAGSSGDTFFYNMTVLVILLGGGVGLYISKKIDMTALPQLVAAFHSLVGLAAVFIAAAVFTSPDVFGIPGDTIPFANAIEMSLGAAIGAVTFTGSVVAFGKLQGFISGKPLLFNGQHKINATIGLCIIASIVMFVSNQNAIAFSMIIALSFLIGYLLIMPIGGADMPVIVSMLNSYSGWAAAGIGFTLNNDMLIIVGALVGTSGAILSHIMCKGMNRSLINVILGGVGGDGASNEALALKEKGSVKLCSNEDAAFIVQNSSSVIIVPGYGMAVAQAQHALKEMGDLLKKEGVNVRYAIHPVAGRMPGHMNVLLAEANIPYEDVLEIDEINHEFGNTDVAIVIGANDITNPSAKTDPASPIYGMPVLDVERARTVLFVKRSLGSGYAGIDNPLFYQSNTMMVLGDTKKVCEGILRAIKEAQH